MNQFEAFSRGRALGAMAIASFLLTGCGGDDGGGGGSGGNNTANNTAPSALAGKTYDLNSSNGTAIVAFASPSRYSFQAPGAPLENGNWSGSSDGSTWTVGLTTDAGGSKTLRLTFSGASSGSYTISRSGFSDETGSFTLRNDPTPNDPTATGGGDTSGDGGSDTTTDGSTDPTTDGGNSDTSDGNTDGSATDGGTTGEAPSDQYTGNAPVSLHARTLYGTRTYTETGPNGQTHTYTFIGNMFHDSDPPEESDGIFTYSANNSSATLSLDYTAPQDFANDSHQMNLTFTQRDSGTFTSIYTRGDGTTIVINGEFYLDPIP